MDLETCIEEPVIKNASPHVIAQHMVLHGNALTRTNADGSIDLFLEPWQRLPVADHED